mmetsp:Transcript_109401/g.235639  ORF Transcript_109401/g.235639 Transcript_109401/m.235639 type:complete len:121 (-) Transcript_109401:9-371(-)
MEGVWPGHTYDLLKNNCCNFADRLCQCLGVGGIPDWVMNLAGTGRAIAETTESIDLYTRRVSARIGRAIHDTPGCCRSTAPADVCYGCTLEMCPRPISLQVTPVSRADYVAAGGKPAAGY